MHMQDKNIVKKSENASFPSKYTLVWYGILGMIFVWYSWYDMVFFCMILIWYSWYDISWIWKWLVVCAPGVIFLPQWVLCQWLLLLWRNLYAFKCCLESKVACRSCLQMLPAKVPFTMSSCQPMFICTIQFYFDFFTIFHQIIWSGFFSFMLAGRRAWSRRGILWRSSFDFIFWLLSLQILLAIWDKYI